MWYTDNSNFGGQNDEMFIRKRDSRPTSASQYRIHSRNTWIISEYLMKTENLTHGLFKAVREVFVIYSVFAKMIQ